MNLSTSRNTWPNISQTVQAIAPIKMPSSLRSIKPLDARRDLTKKEKDQLTNCESVLDHGLGTFFDVGNALLTIRDDKLYRVTHQTFESYCRERWGIGRTYAWRSIGAAERIKLLPEREDLPRPANEFQIRPFLSLEPKKFPMVWERVAKRAKGCKITSKLVTKVIKEFAPSATSEKPGPKHRQHMSLPKTTSVGELLLLIQDTIRAVEGSQQERAISSLKKMEGLLLGE